MDNATLILIAVVAALFSCIPLFIFLWVVRKDETNYEKILGSQKLRPISRRERKAISKEARAIKGWYSRLVPCQGECSQIINSWSRNPICSACKSKQRIAKFQSKPRVLRRDRKRIRREQSK